LSANAMGKTLCISWLLVVAAAGMAEGREAGPPAPVKLSQMPSTAEIIYHRDGYLWTMDRDGQHVTQLTFEPAPYEHAAVSPDHRFIAADLNPPDDQSRFSLVVYDLLHGTQTALVPEFHVAGDGGVDWDQQGYVYFVGKPTAHGHKDLYKIRYDGTGLMQLTQTPGVSECDPSVSDDGTTVIHCLFVPEPARNTAHTELWTMATDGTGPRRLYQAGQVWRASAHDPELSPDNASAVFSMVNATVPPNFPAIPAANTAHDIWKVQRDGGGLTRLTQPGPISILPDWKEDLVLYTEISERDRYSGTAIVSAQGHEQLPRRIQPGANGAKWIP